MLKLLLKLDDWIDSRTQMREIKRLQKIADAAKEYARSFGHLVPEAIAEESRRLRERLRASPADAVKLQPRALAIGGLAVERVLGFAPNSTQIIGALLMVHGNIIEISPPPTIISPRAISAGWGWCSVSWGPRLGWSYRRRQDPKGEPSIRKMLPMLRIRSWDLTIFGITLKRMSPIKHPAFLIF